MRGRATSTARRDSRDRNLKNTVPRLAGAASAIHSLGHRYRESSSRINFDGSHSFGGANITVSPPSAQSFRYTNTLYMDLVLKSTTVAPSVCGEKCPPSSYLLNNRCALIPRATHFPVAPAPCVSSSRSIVISGVTCARSRRQSSSAARVDTTSTVSAFRNDRRFGASASACQNVYPARRAASIRKSIEKS